MFEPASLHKYLYCGADPVGNWDPSGEFPVKLIGYGLIAMTILIMFARMPNIIGSVLSWIKKKEKITWEGVYGVATMGKYAGVGALIALLHTVIEGKQVNEQYFILMIGFAYSLVPLNYSLSPVKLEVPGIYGPNPAHLKGPCTWASIAWTIDRPDPLASFGLAATDFTMGKGKGEMSKLPFIPNTNFIVGREKGGEYMFGWSWYLRDIWNMYKFLMP